MELHPLTPELKERFKARKRRQMVPKLRLGLTAGAVLFVSFLLWDYLVVPASLSQTLPLRGIFAGAFLVLLGLTYIPALQRFPSVLLQAGVVLGASGVSAIGAYQNSVHVFSTSALMLVIVVIAALAPSLRSAICSFSLMLVTSGLFMKLAGTPLVSIVAVGLFVFSAGVVACLLAAVTERMDLRAFQLEHTLEQMASTDPLTGVRNRRAFFEAGDTELERADRYGFPVSAFVLDIDHFKAVNDTYGHPVGDAVIRAVAQTALRTLRATDVLGRIGGEEFAILSTHTGEDEAQRLAERLREEVASTLVQCGLSRLHVTISVGTATWDGDGESFEELLARADSALYMAKHAGRNRVAVAAHAA